MFVSPSHMGQWKAVDSNDSSRWPFKTPHPADTHNKTRALATQTQPLVRPIHLAIDKNVLGRITPSAVRAPPPVFLVVPLFKGTRGAPCDSSCPPGTPGTTSFMSHSIACHRMSHSRRRLGPLPWLRPRPAPSASVWQCSRGV